VLETAITESERGFKPSKLKQSHKIDLNVALAMAALGAVQRKGSPARSTWPPSAATRAKDWPSFSAVARLRTRICRLGTLVFAIAPVMYLKINAAR